MNRAPAAILLAAALAGCATAPRVGQHARPFPRPTLHVRASPPVAFTGTPVVVMAELRGEVTDEFRCPRVAWDFGDGDVSVRESDCGPDEPGAVRWSLWHCYRVAGEHLATVTLSKASRELARESASVTIRWRPGRGC